MGGRNSSRRLVRVCVTTLAVGWAISGTGFLDAIEQRIDYLTALIARHDRAAERIVLVPITRDEFGDLSFFGGRRPLDPGLLRRLVERVAASRPAVIAVDLDTGPEVFASLRTLDRDIPVVWARSARGTNPTEPSPILGYASVEVEGDVQAPSGIARVRQDDDGIVRSYIRRFETSFGVLPSFACAVVTRCADNTACAADVSDDVRAACREATADREWRIDYRDRSKTAWRGRAIPARRLLEGSTVAPDILRDRIVLIGGTFIEGGDADHPTPLGEDTGIGVLAQVLATELRGGGASPGGTLATAILVALDTYLILIVLEARTRRQRLAGATALIVCLAVLLSLVNEGDLRRTGHFALVLFFFLLLQVALRYVEGSQELFVAWWRGRTARAC
jgi:CHASE2 domain-containing sensor protein